MKHLLLNRKNMEKLMQEMEELVADCNASNK